MSQVKPHAPQPDPLPLTSHTVVTPLKAGSFSLQLRAHPDRAFAHAVVSDIQRGACIGYIGSRSTLRARNLRSATINPDVISEVLHKECAAGHMAGPYDCPPCPKFQSSRVVLVPKKSGKMRMITHLSAPAGRSINDFIPKALYSLQYTLVDDAIAIIRNYGLGALMANTDVKQAFRLIPVQPADWPLLGFLMSIMLLTAFAKIGSCSWIVMTEFRSGCFFASSSQNSWTLEQQRPQS